MKKMIAFYQPVNLVDRIIFKILIVPVLCCIVLNTAAQTPASSKQVNVQSQAWYSINSTMHFYKKWGMVADVHVRTNNFMGDQGFYFLRTGINYWFKDNITFTLGVGKMWVAPITPGWQHFAEENRIYQQVQIATKLGKIGIVNRLRNEQRWQEKVVNDKFTGEYKFTDRIRYLFSTTTPFFKNPHYPSMVISDEISIQTGKEVVYNTFDQNRFFIGIRQMVNKNLSFDLGYMQLYQQKANGYQYDKNHTFRLFFYYTPDFRKKVN